MLTEWKRGEYIRLARYAGYANRDGKPDGYTGSKRPLVDEARFVIVPDDSTAKAALQRGDIDIIEDLSNNDVPVLRQDPNVRVAYAPVMSMTALLMQTRDPLLADPRLRQALAHAIDYAQLAAAVTEGLAQPNNSIVPLVSSYHGAAQRQGWQYDPALAARLARDAGYKGQELTILTTKRYPQSYNSAVIVQAMLQAAGFNARLSVLEWAAQLDRYNAGNYQLMTFLLGPARRRAELRDGDRRQGQAAAQGLGQPRGRQADRGRLGGDRPRQAAGDLRSAAPPVPGRRALDSAVQRPGHRRLPQRHQGLPALGGKAARLGSGAQRLLARRAASRRAAQPANNSAATKSTKARILGDSCRLDGHST